MTKAQVMTDHYIAAIYFTETGDGDQPSADAKLTPLCRMQCYLDCQNFLWALEDYPEIWELPGITVEQLGHDLWLTRNGHGCGFWDRPEMYGEELAKWLTRMATAMGGHDADFEEEVEA